MVLLDFLAPVNAVSTQTGLLSVSFSKIIKNIEFLGDIGVIQYNDIYVCI